MSPTNPSHGALAALDGAPVWLNSEPLTAAGLRGRVVHVDAGGLAEPADWGALRSPETYLGDARGERRSDRRSDRLALNQWTLAGDWTVDDESAVLEGAGGAI